jgi:hypothetical protein
MEEQKPDKYPNLRRFKAGDEDWRTPEQRRRNASLGAQATNENRRKRKKLAEAAKWLLAEKDVISDAKVKEKLRELGIDDATNAEALMLIALKKASMGNVEAMKFVRDTGGESPSNRVELTGDPERPVATMDLRSMSEEELMRLAEARSDVPDEDPEMT